MAQNLTFNDGTLPHLVPVKDRTLFHLVPVPGNKDAEDVLSEHDNRTFVSLSAANTRGLEIGFHVPRFPRSGRIITGLGRKTDLILPQSYSSVHLEFEVNPEPLVVMLSVRAKEASCVTTAAITEGDKLGPAISGNCAISYGQAYPIRIASYLFNLVWRSTEVPDRIQSLKKLTTEGYEDAMQRVRHIRSRDRSITGSSTAISWYTTRLQSAKAPLFTELQGSRVLIGQGAFANVYKTVDQTSGNYFAVKEVDIKRIARVDLEKVRICLRREIKCMQTLSHDHIIEFLGTHDLNTDKPLIYMPLCQGTLQSLVGQGKLTETPQSLQVLREMLGALDYLAFRNCCHRDVKPANILYTDAGPGKVSFKLADFGLANDFRNARTWCGTPLYAAPEVLLMEPPQTPKMDMWSLFVTMAVILPDYRFPPKTWTSHKQIISAVQEVAAAGDEELRPMARLDPMRRASAAQMLVTYFGGDGLTTPRNQVPPIEPDVPQQPLIPLGAPASSGPGPRRHRESSPTASRRGRRSSPYGPKGRHTRNSRPQRPSPISDYYVGGRCRRHGLEEFSRRQ